MLLCSFDQRACIRKGQRDGLFDDDMAAGGDHIQRDGRMLAAFSSHSAKLRMLFGKHLAVIRIAAHAGALLLRQGSQHNLHALDIRVAHSAQLQ